MLDVKAVTTYEEFLNLEPLWNTVLADSDGDMLFMTFEWFKHWWRMFGHRVEMLVLLVRNADKDVVAIAPLIQKKIWHRGLPVKVISFMANYYTPRAGMIITDRSYKAVEAVFSYLRHNKLHYDMVYLDMIETGSQTEMQIKTGLLENESAYREMEGENSPYLNMAGSWDDYIKGKSGNFRRNMGRYTGNFVPANGYRIVQYGCADVSIATEEIIAISKKTWKYDHGSGIAGSQNSIDYYRSLLRLFADSGWLRVNVLKHNDRPVAFTFSGEYKKTIYGLQTGYDLAYKSSSPGRFMMIRLIRDSFEAGIRQLDLLGKDEPYKIELTSTRRGHSKYFIFNDTLTGGLLHTIETVILPGARGLFTLRPDTSTEGR